MHWVAGVQAVLAMSEPTCWALCYRGADCLSGVYCVAGVQAVLAMSEPTCRALCYSGADCLSGVGTYLPGFVLQWRRLFKRCRNLTAGHCVTVGKTV